MQSQAEPGIEERCELWDEWKAEWNEIHEIAKTFILANCYDPKFVMLPSLVNPDLDPRYQVSDPAKPMNTLTEELEIKI